MTKRALPIFLIIVLLFIFNEKALSDNLTAYDILKSEKPAYKNDTIILDMVTWYQKNISDKNGPSCMFYPTCSSFFKEAVIKYGLLWATLMTVDRMFYRENYLSMKQYPYLRKYERYHDPVENHYIFRIITK